MPARIVETVGIATLWLAVHGAGLECESEWNKNGRRYTY